MPSDFHPESAIEALADAWASIDGKLDEFRAGKGATRYEDEPGMHYSGYIEDAKGMAKRLEARGYIIVEKPNAG